VHDSIKFAAGLQPSYQHLLKERTISGGRPIVKDHPVIVEIVTAGANQIDVEKLNRVLAANDADSTALYNWQNRYVYFGKVKDVSVLSGRLRNAFPAAEIKVYHDLFYEFNRSHCEVENIAGEWQHIILTANLVNEPSLQKEYLDHHATQFEKWPEVSKGFCNADFQQLLLFRKDRQLMLVISIPKGKTLDELNPKTTQNNPRVDTWNALMKKYQEGIPGTKPGEVWVFLNPVDQTKNEKKP
jgi:hypothetical protein